MLFLVVSTHRPADIIPVHFDTYPLIDVEPAKRILADQAAPD